MHIYISDILKLDANDQLGALTHISSSKTDVAYWQDLLHLSQFGGHITRERQDVYHLAYEFNAVNADNWKAAVPWNPMEMLFEEGLIAQYGAASAGDNLTEKGHALLRKLEGIMGKSPATLNFTAAAPAEATP
jgi:predicted transcriptional regulator